MRPTAVKVSLETLRGILRTSEFPNSSSKMKTFHKQIPTHRLFAFPSWEHRLSTSVSSHMRSLWLSNDKQASFFSWTNFAIILPRTTFHLSILMLLNKARDETKPFYREGVSNQKTWSWEHSGGLCTEKNVASVVADKLTFTEKHIGMTPFL